ncbi:MAG: carbamate kinase, partial [Acidobacteria bacterium]|nr:carbamate kinase [Acidobacteriota bacterium]
AEQLANTRRTAKAIVGVLRLGFRVVITHGNGPQVGAALLRSERASDQVYSHSLDVCDATTQGEIGYLLQQSVHNELSEAGLALPVVTLLSQVVVRRDDPALQHPTKPIGPFYSRADAEAKKRLLGWGIVEDAARGYRRVVPSPEPVEIVEEDVIHALLSQGVLVIAVGGGGIPVVRENGALVGIEAVIDKDRASALLAGRLGVDLFVISTDADRVYLDYRRPTQRPVDRATADEMARHLEAGQFPPGNMGPKIESALRFLRAGGSEVIITSYDRLCEAVGGTAGTHIVP